MQIGMFSFNITNLEEDAESWDRRVAYTAPVRVLINPVPDVFISGKFDRRVYLSFRNSCQIMTYANGTRLAIRQAG